jgi:protoporphyrin/coproporphyrin ferrochelatase
MTTGILLVNLGTPEKPTLLSVFRYLNQFLTDGRVIDLSWWKRQLLVRGYIVPLRLRQSTHSYQRIWTPEGSPLMIYGIKVKEALQRSLGDAFCIQLAMRYQKPSLEEGLDRLMRQQPEKLIILPLFPQYASATTGSVHQKIMELMRHYTLIPDVTFISQFASHPAFLDAFSEVAAPLPLSDYDHHLFSFHGLPERQITKERSYLTQCLATTGGLVDRLKLTSYSVCFQSRLGKEPWLQPYTSDRLIELAKEGKKRVLVFCPSFVCDCLETLFEIGEEYAALFKKAGGETLDLVPGLNDHPVWIEALKKILIENKRNCC